MQFPFKGLGTAIGLAVLSLSTLRAQVRPLPVIPPDSLVQTYTGRLAHTLFNGYVTHDSLNARLNAYVPQAHLNATLDGYVLHDDLNTTLSGYVTTSDSHLSDSRTPKGSAGGSLTGTYPNPTIKSSVNLPGSPTTTTQASTDNSTKVATTAYVKNNLTSYVTTSDSRLSDSRIPKGSAGGSLTGTYPNPTIKSSVNLPGSPTTTTQASTDNSTKVATTAYVKNNLTSYVTTSDSRLSDSRIPKGSASGDLIGNYPNPTIKSNVTLTGNPTVAGNLTANGILTVNGTGESLIKGNLRLKGSSAYGNKINLGDGDYVYLHEATDDNLTVKAKNIDLAPTTSVTAPTPITSDNSNKIATTAYVQNHLANRVKIIAAGHYTPRQLTGQTYLNIGSWSTSNTSTGIYTINVYAGIDLTQCVVLVTGLNGYVATLQSQNSGAFVVKLYNGTTLANATVGGGFYFIVLGF